MARSPDEIDRMIEELRVEVAAQRLVTRSLIAFLFFQKGAPLTKLVSSLAEANEQMSSARVPIADLDPELHAKAAALARKRSEQLLADLGPLLMAAPGTGPKQPVPLGQLANERGYSGR